MSATLKPFAKGRNLLPRLSLVHASPCRFLVLGVTKQSSRVSILAIPPCILRRQWRLYFLEWDNHIDIILRGSSMYVRAKMFNGLPVKMMPFPISSFIKVSYNYPKVKEIWFTGDTKSTITSIRFFAGCLLWLKYHRTGYYTKCRSSPSRCHMNNMASIRLLHYEANMNM